MKKFFYSMFMLAAMLSFTACEDVPSPYDIPNGSAPEQKEDEYSNAQGSGTLEDPYNVEALLKLVSGMAANDQSGEIYFKGKIVSIKEEYSTQYDNATFYISDDGSTTNQFYIFRALYFGGKEYNNGQLNIKVGDEVLMKGKITNYNGNIPESVQKECEMVSINGTTGGGSETPDKTIGSIDNPKTCTEALAVINALADGASTDELYYVKGKIKQIKTSKDNIEEYKNIDYVITDGTSDITVFRGKNLDNTDFTTAGQINEGDEVIVLGKLQKYVNNSGAMTPEVAEGNYIVKLTKGSGGGGGSETPTGDVLTVAKACEMALAGTTGTVTVKGIVCKVKGYYNSKYITYFISDDGKDENSLQIYNGLGIGGASFTSQDDVQVGDEVTVKGDLTLFNGAPEINKDNQLVSIKKGSGGGGSSEPSEPSGIGTVSGNTITVNATAFGVENGVEMGKKTLADGTVLTFDGGGNTLSPKYYSTGESVRMYPKNTLSIAAQKEIASIVITCIENSGTLCNASQDVTASPGSISFDGNDIKITSVGSKNTVITDTSNGTGAGSQIRFNKIVITYK